MTAYCSVCGAPLPNLEPGHRVRCPKVQGFGVTVVDQPKEVLQA